MVFYLQKGISKYFRNKQPMDSTIDQLRRGHLDPLGTPWLTLNVIKANGEWSSTRKRPLYGKPTPTTTRARYARSAVRHITTHALRIA